MKLNFWSKSGRDEGRWGKDRHRGWRVFLRKFFFPQLVDLASNTSTVVPDTVPLPGEYNVMWMRRAPKLFCVIPRKLDQDNSLILEDVAPVEDTRTGSCQKSASEGDQTLRRHSSLLDLVQSWDISRPTQNFGCPSMEFVYSLQECLRYVADKNLI
ncbi:uncharacterized protein LOC121370860 [Gigantopelta aegis]|uniref:uncharacterized protein LOC121370860 n=1 Tax=Gigantopelta aegis TaxID=1735272 RepID=UPI001B889499|nr:uncharacterized protein LOC121370860 [Gigantopelta aegis]